MDRRSRLLLICIRHKGTSSSLRPETTHPLSEGIVGSIIVKVKITDMSYSISNLTSLPLTTPLLNTFFT